MSVSPQAQLEEFIGKYTPEMATLTRAVLKKMRVRLTGAKQLVYDNYNSLAIGFSSTERAGDVIFSVVPYPRWLLLFFFHATKLPDPEKLLKGSGKVVRSVVVNDAKDLDAPALKKLMEAALKCASVTIDPKQKSQIVIKSISAKQRPRRPAVKVSSH